MADYIEKLDVFLKTRWFENVITGVIVVYTVILAVELSLTGWQYILVWWLHQILLWVMILEVSLRVICAGYYGSTGATRTERNWLRFDVLVTIIAILPQFQPLRALRALRLLHRITFFKQPVENSFEAIGKSLVYMGIGAFLIVVNALVGHHAYHMSIPEKFGTMSDAFLTTYIMMWREDLSNLYPMREAHWITAVFYEGLLLAVTIPLLSFIVAVLVQGAVVEVRKKDDS